MHSRALDVVRLLGSGSCVVEFARHARFRCDRTGKGEAAQACQCPCSRVTRGSQGGSRGPQGECNGNSWLGQLICGTTSCRRRSKWDPSSQRLDDGAIAIAGRCISGQRAVSWGMASADPACWWPPLGVALASFGRAASCRGLRTAAAPHHARPTVRRADGFSTTPHGSPRASHGRPSFLGSSTNCCNGWAVGEPGAAARAIDRRRAGRQAAGSHAAASHGRELAGPYSRP